MNKSTFRAGSNKRRHASNVESRVLKRRANKRKFSSIQQVVKNETTLELFCRCMSIRGVNKFTSKSIFLRSLWSTFILLMTLILMYATSLLIMDYFKYDVTLHQRDLKHSSCFPAITICHHHPFSKEAYTLWDRKEVLSPTLFNAYMREKALYYLDRKEDFAMNFYHFDSINIYYQNLKYNESIALGHPPSIVLNCLKRSAIQIDFENDCEKLDGYRVRRFSHHQHFNCLTYEPNNPKVGADTQFFSLIVSLGRAQPDYDNHEQGLLIDVFEQARGLRAVVHEPGTLPDLESDGLHVEPGKLNEINFHPVLNIRLDTPTRPCIKPNITHAFFDLDSYYNYTSEECIRAQQQSLIIKSCKCMYAMYPRPQIPTDNIPYCGKMWPTINEGEFIKRLECVNKCLKTTATPEMIAKCRPRCQYYTYEATVSITKWRAKQWQLHWLRLQNIALEWILNSSYNETVKEKGRDLWRSYLKRKNLSDFNLEDSRKALNLEGDDFAYVVLKRKSSILKERREKEVLSLTVLLSRIGGFCSLLIGLTVAAIVEFIEFIYLLIQRNLIKRVSLNEIIDIEPIINNFAVQPDPVSNTQSGLSNVYYWQEPERPQKEILL